MRKSCPHESDANVLRQRPVEKVERKSGGKEFGMGVEASPQSKHTKWLQLIDFVEKWVTRWPQQDEKLLLLRNKENIFFSGILLGRARLRPS